MLLTGQLTICAFVLQFFIKSSICEPLTIGLGAAGVTTIGFLLQWTGMTHYLHCAVSECCGSSYIDLNSEQLKRDLNSKLHGQHLVIPTVLSAMKAHKNDKNPTKPLVLSFHGWTGGGKNFVSRFVIKNLYAEGEKSKFVHLFNSEIHFKHASKVDEYKDQLHSWIYHNVSTCSQSLFVFDEMDHMPEGMIDVLVPFLGHNTQVDNVDFRKAIFIFLSNTGGNHITEAVLQQWQSGKPRNEMRLRDMQQILERSAYNQKSGLKHSKLVHKNLIDHFIPFLPLEREHVRACIVDEFKRQNVTNYTEEDIKEVLGELQWFPKDLNLFSKSGCKKIGQKISFVVFGDD